MAVDATADDLALPVEVAFVFAGEQRDFDGRGEGRGLTLFAGERGLVHGIRGVDGERGFECALVAEGGFLGRVFLVGPRAVAAVDRAVGVEEEGGEGEVVVELEFRQLDGIGVDEPHANELVE